jgi:hypothetical protein
MDKTSIELGAAYAELRATVNSLVVALGSDKFAFSVVTVGAREAVRHVMPDPWRRGFKSHMSFCESLMASPEQLHAAKQRLTETFSVRQTAETSSGKLGHGRLVVRDERMYFETGEAAALFAHCYVASVAGDKWTTAMTSDAETYLVENSMKKPSVSVVHTKSKDAAMKALQRIAEQHFHVNLNVLVDDHLNAA